MRSKRRGLARAREYSRIIGEARGYRLSAWQWLNKERTLFDPSKKTNKGIILASTALLVLVILSPTAVFHSYVTNPVDPSFSALEQSCQLYHNPATCATVALNSHDPTYPITKYVSPSSSLSEFNTAGNTKFSTSCGPTFTSSKCINMVGTAPPPPLSGQFRQIPGTSKITSATITPQTASFSYKRATGFSNNSTFVFDVSGGHAQTGTWLISTTSTTTVTFIGAQPTVTCPNCSTMTYANGEEVLTFGPGLSSASFTLVFTGQNLSCLCAIAETVNSVGDLSAVVAKELEFSYYFAPSSLVSTGCVTSRCFGFFLTTNASLWQTNLASFDPYTDPTVSLLDVMVNGVTANNNLYIQQKPGETIQSEDTGCGTGSAYICSLLSGAGNGLSAYMVLNYTGGSTGAQVGNGVNCPTAFPGPGGAGCSYIQSSDCPLGGCMISNTVTAFSPLTPKLPITGAIYYAGFWVSSALTTSTISFCFDTGAKCSAQQTPIVNGCVTASMELDSCVPNPVAGNAVNSVTDSGGFVGSIFRFLSSTGQSILGLGASAVSFITSSLSGPWNAFWTSVSNLGSTLLLRLFAAIISLMNALGSIIGIPNLGTALFTFLQGISGLFTSFLTNLLTNLINQVSVWVQLASGITGLLTTYWTNAVQWFTGIFNFLGFLWQVAGLLFGIPFAFMFTGWMFYGILRALRSMQSWWDWYHTTGYGVLLGLSVSWYFFVLFVNNIIIPIVNTVTSMATTEQAVKPDLGGAAAAAAA